MRTVTLGLHQAPGLRPFSTMRMFQSTYGVTLLFWQFAHFAKHNWSGPAEIVACPSFRPPGILKGLRSQFSNVAAGGRGK